MCVRGEQGGGLGVQLVVGCVWLCESRWEWGWGEFACHLSTVSLLQALSLLFVPRIPQATFVLLPGVTVP